MPATSTPAKKPQLIEVTFGDDLYQATRDGADDPWAITFPEGDRQFYGTPAECRAKMKTIAAENKDDPVPLPGR